MKNSKQWELSHSELGEEKKKLKEVHGVPSQIFLNFWDEKKKETSKLMVENKKSFKLKKHRFEMRIVTYAICKRSRASSRQCL